MKVLFNCTIAIILFLVLVFSSCTDNGSNAFLTDNFDRKLMLENWADQIIIPSLESYLGTLESLMNEKNAFSNDSSLENLAILRSRYIDAYHAWQNTAMFDIGPAETLGLRNFTNIFPCDTSLINQNIAAQNYNLELPSNFDAQGLAAVDFILFGLSDDETELLNILSQDEYINYLNDLVNRLHTLTSTVLTSWKEEFKTQFVNNNGSSGTASVDKMVNDFLFYYEKFLRAGKIGIPAGVFSGDAISQNVEAPYSRIYSKSLCLESLNAVINFFEGISFDGQNNFQSLKAYLEHIETLNEIEVISTGILSQWSIANEKVEALSDNFKEQVEVDNTKMLEAYDELQKAVVLLKVDMMQALNIQVDYVDADGD